MWNRGTLSGFAKEHLRDRFLVVVSNREPYAHYRSGGSIRVERGGGGLTTVLDTVMQAIGGVWVAWGSGNADWEVTDSEGKIAVPPHKPSYTLKRVRLTQEEVEHYYHGFSNRFFWPFFHNMQDRVHFLEKDWEYYKEANFRFAEAILSEVRGHRSPVVWIQDYHLSCVPRMVRERRPDAILSIFWHIPWPFYDIFRTAPCRRELLKSLLCCNLIGLQTPSDRDHFLEAVREELGLPIDYSTHVVEGDHPTQVQNFSASIDTEVWMHLATRPEIDEEMVRLRQHLGLKSTGFLGVGVDRLEYTKGLLNRFEAIDIFLKNDPQYCGKFTFLQIAPPTRTAMPEYQAYGEQVKKKVEQINAKYGFDRWKPIELLPVQIGAEELAVYYRAADLAIISSFADGMNLVAKEFVASQVDEKGVLLLSQFAGAAHEMKGALLIDPYNTEQFAKAIKLSLEMPLSDKKARIQEMQTHLKANNVYKWVGDQLLENTKFFSPRGD